MRNLVVSAGVLATCAGVAMAQPRVVPIDGVPTDVTNGGAVIVGASSGAFRLTLNGSQYDFFRISSNDNAPATSLVSDDGVTVITEMPNDSLSVGLLGAVVSGKWTQAGGFVNLGHYLMPSFSVGTPLPPGYMNLPKNASRDGRWVVGLGFTGSQTFRAFLTDASVPVSIDLGSLGQGSQSFSVSDDGSVVGGRDSGPTLNGDRATIWRRNLFAGYDAFHLDPEGDIQFSDVGVYAVSADGTIAAGKSAQFPGRLTRWLWNGSAYVLQDLGLPIEQPPDTFGDPFSVQVTGMSADGSVMVGTMSYGFFSRRGFIWTAALGFKDLESHLASLGTIGLAGVSTAIPAAISSDGLTVVGSGAPFSGGPSWVAFLNGGPCITPQSQPRPSTSNISACDSIAFLNAAATGSGPFTYQWRLNGVPLTIPGPGPGGSTYEAGFFPGQFIIFNANPQNVGTYDCVITGECGSTTIEPIVMTSEPTSPGDLCGDPLVQMGEGEQSITMCGAYVTDGTASCRPDSRGDVWIRYTPSFTGMARISTCGGFSDTVLSVFDTCGGTELACADDECDFMAQIDRMAVTAGVPVLVRVAGGFAVPSLPVTVRFSVAPPPAPHDSCADPLVIGPGVATLDTTEASPDGTASCNPAPSKDVWFSYTPTAAGIITLSTCESNFNTVLSVYRGGCGGDEIACNDNGDVDPCFLASLISDLPVAANETLLIRVGGGQFSGRSGQVTLHLAFAPPPCLVDFNDDGFLNQEDLNGYIAAFLDELVPPGPSGTNRAPCPEAPAPYDMLGYAADFNRDCNFDQEDLSGFITEFFLESENPTNCIPG